VVTEAKRKGGGRSRGEETNVVNQIKEKFF
jgi:hypothetical protein